MGNFNKGIKTTRKKEIEMLALMNIIFNMKNLLDRLTRCDRKSINKSEDKEHFFSK